MYDYTREVLAGKPSATQLLFGLRPYSQTVAMGDDDTFRREVTDLVESGWRIESETPERVTLVKRDFGSAKTHLLIAVLTIWWLMGIPNLLYAAYKYFNDSERTIVWKEKTTDKSEVTGTPMGTE